jgi:signal transduction histidine kinase
MARGDVAVAAGFVLAAITETVVLHHGSPGPLALGLGGAPVLAVMAVRRSRPALVLGVIAVFAMLGTVLQAVLLPDADDGGGVWMFALLFAAYSLGAHGRGRWLLLGALLPLLVVLAVDVPTMTGWDMVSGVLFVTTFVGLLPTLVGRVVRVRRERLTMLAEQRDRILRERRAERETAVLAERLRASDRLQPALLDGLRALARSAAAGADPGSLETTARGLLTRTREEVVALTAPVEVLEPPEPPAPDHVRALRTAAQPWAVVGAGAVATGLALESTWALSPATPDWVAVLTALLLGVPLALVWWRPLPMLAVAWLVATAYSRLIAPLDGSLSGAGLALAASFAVAALSTRRAAVAGLLLCWLGQDVGVGARDVFGDTVIMLVCWLGGLAVNEATRLVERSHANNAVLAGQRAAAAVRAVVDERFRLARELHDQIGHSLTVVALQAGAARRLGDTDPDRSAVLLQVIATAARNGVAALEGGQQSTDLAALLELTRGAGLAVDATLDERALTDADERAVVYRLVQEALTNVLRHSPGARAEVAVQRRDSAVVVTVVNTAPTGPGAGPGGGRGLAGIRERVTAWAGEVRWGPLPDGGFEVCAVLPARRLEGTTP